MSPYVLPDPGGRLEVGPDGKLYESMGDHCACKRQGLGEAGFVGTVGGLALIAGVLWLGMKLAPSASGRKKR